MFGLDPFNPSIAITEIVLLLALAAFVGWLLGRMALNGRIKALRTNIADREAELNDLRQSRTTVVTDQTTPMAPVTPMTVSANEPVRETNTTLESSKSTSTFNRENTLGVDVPGMEMPREAAAEALEVPPAMKKPNTEELSQDDEQTKATKTLNESIPVVSDTATGATTGQDSMDRSSSGSSLRSGLDMPDVSNPGTSIPGKASPGTSIPNTSSPGTSIPGTSEAAVLSRIAARAHEVNFDRIGRATAAEADDLKDIIGIGPFLERKLNAIGIYTYRQVANFTREDAETVNRIIEFFPGRIERDNWVDQSQAFHERKYGPRS